jgi:hypothetical protein
MENTQRNVNLIKPLYQVNTGLPFSKPRYILGDNDLKLMNSPTISPVQIPEVLENIETWDLKMHEQFLIPENYQDRIWFRSKLISLVSEIAAPVETDPFFYDLNKEPARLTLEIINSFKKGSKESRSDFLIVHIPIILDLIHLSLNQDFIYSDMLAEIEADTDVIRTQDALLAEVRQASFSSLYMPGGHYSAKGNEMIAEMVAEHILGMNHQKLRLTH